MQFMQHSHCERIDMDLRDLKLFLHLAESHHFGRTAKAMHVSPSTLSRQIQRLEGSSGSRCFCATTVPCS